VNAGGNPNNNLHFIFALLMGIFTLKLFYVFTSSVSLKSLMGQAPVDDIPPLRGQDLDCEYREEKNSGGIVYESAALDLLESSFLVNLSLLTYFTLHSGQGSQNIVFSISASVVLVAFVGIVFYHLCVYTPFSIFVKKLRHACSSRGTDREVQFEGYRSIDHASQLSTKTEVTHVLICNVLISRYIGGVWFL
jgi:hypothetical protein